MENNSLASESKFKSYLIFWMGQLFSLLGSSITQFAIIWWLTEASGSTVILSIASFFYILPLTIVVPIAGVFADRLNRKKILIVVDSCMASVILFLIFSFNFGLKNPIVIIITTGFLGLFQGFHAPTLAAIVPTMVPKDKLSRMNGVNFLLTGFMYIIGPVIASLLLAFIPIEILLWIDPLTFLIALVPLILIKIPSVKKDDTKVKGFSFIEDFKDGFRTLRLIPTVILMLLVAMFINFLWRPYGVLLPYFIKFDHGGTVSDLAFVMALMNIGMFLGAILTSVKKEWKHSTSFYFGGELSLMIFYAVVAVTPHGSFLIMGVAAACLGFIVPIVNTIYLTKMQLKVPVEKMGRISSIDWMVSSVMSPIATIITGPLAEIFGVANLYLTSAIIGIIIALTFWWIAHVKITQNNDQLKEELVIP
ncbi:MAG: MFS transporter [Candidatus Lokiarchaeota archaeon]|nr:MFS transporter [Candidatus Lokiarchaeota archaeon]